MNSVRSWLFGCLVILQGCTASDTKRPLGPDEPMDAPVHDGDAASLVPCEMDPSPLADAGGCIAIGVNYECNPVSGLGCGNDQVCAFDGVRFRCLPSRNPSAACGSCSATQACTGGFTCIGLGSRCTRFCCDSNECAKGTTCVMQPPTSVGVCQATSAELLHDFVLTGVNDAGTLDLIRPACVGPSDASTGACVPVNETNACNPVTNAGCSAGRTCEHINGGYQCVVGSLSKNICETCTGVGDCQPGLTCAFSGTCAKSCCADIECAPAVCKRMGGAAGVCTSYFSDAGDACPTCTVFYCSKELSACGANATCAACLADASASACETDMLYAGQLRCRCDTNTCAKYCKKICP